VVLVLVLVLVVFWWRRCKRRRERDSKKKNRKPNMLFNIPFVIVDSSFLVHFLPTSSLQTYTLGFTG